MAKTLWTRTRDTGYVEIRGLQEALNAMGVFTDPAVFNKMVTAELAAAAKEVIVPAIQGEAKSASKYSPSRSRTRGKQGRRGPLAKTVTVKNNKRKYRRNSTEVAAVNVGPRAWYRHFVVQGTRRHSLAKGAKLRTGKFQDRGRIHPGAKPNDFVGRAVKGKDAALTREMGKTPLAEYKRRLGKRITL